jgi:hypothetical protein
MLRRINNQYAIRDYNNRPKFHISNKPAIRSRLRKHFSIHSISKMILGLSNITAAGMSQLQSSIRDICREVTRTNPMERPRSYTMRLSLVHLTRMVFTSAKQAITTR